MTPTSASSDSVGLVLGLMALMFVTALIGVIVSSCATEPKGPVLILEQDGIRVYRYYDNGHYIYYTDKNGASIATK